MKFTLAPQATGSGARMVIEKTYPNLSQIYQTKFELDRVKQFIPASDCGITEHWAICQEGSILMDAPAHTTMHQLMQKTNLDG